MKKEFIVDVLIGIMLNLIMLSNWLVTELILRMETTSGLETVGIPLGEKKDI